MPSLLKRVFGRIAEKRDLGWGLGFLSGDWWGSAGFGAGYDKVVPPAVAQGLAAVVGCVELISAAIASLPVSLTMDTPDGRKAAPPTVAAWSLLRRPNSFQSWPAWAQWCAAEVLLQGNAISFKRLDGSGNVTDLVPCPWAWLLPKVIDTGDGLKLRLDRIYTMPAAQLLNLPDRLLPDEVLHVRGRSDEGVIGRSVIGRAARPINEGIEIGTVASATWQNGMRPSGVYSIDGTLDKEARKRFRESIAEAHEGPKNISRMLILDRSGKYQQTSFSSVDSEFLSTRMFSVSEVCRLFLVPEPLLQIGQRLPSDLGTFTAALATQALAPLISLIENEFDHAVLPPGYHLQIDMSGLLRGSYSAAVAALCAAVQSGIATPNDGRKSLGWPAIQGADTLRTGSAPNWPADGKGMPHLGPSPGPGGDLPEPGNHGNEGAASA